MDTMSFEELQQVVSVCLDEIVRLKEENNHLQQQVNDLAQSNRKITSLISQLGQKHELTLHLLHRTADNLYYEIADDRQQVYPIPQFYDISYTIDEIIHKHKSLARFGDGEFTIMLGTTRQKFQEHHPLLEKRLLEVLHSDNDSLLIGIADNYGTLEQYTDQSRQEIRSYMSPEIRKYHNMLLQPTRTYHNAYISRPYAMYADNDTDAPLKRFNALKKIWENRDVIVIEGSLTRLGVGNDLFQNVGNLIRIEAPAVNAFSRYDDILSAARTEAAKHPDSRNLLFIIALGATACLLASDLCQDGYQALDLGHIDLEYEWFLNGSGHRCIVPTKYNNECYGGDQVQDVQDETYFSQIVASIE